MIFQSTLPRRERQKIVVVCAQDFTFQSTLPRRERPGDECGYWLGAWGSARIDDYLLVSNRDLVVFKSDDDVFDVLERCLSDDMFEKLPEPKEECRPIYDALPWIKAIIVYIDCP